MRIYNFVEHLDQRTGSLDGYIVMEYVGGKSLKDIANERRTPDGRRDPLPVEQACAYGIEALEALGHLHSRNLLYCDFKVDNAIQQHDQLKLIDMGAVRRMDDDESAIYGTVGYQAPEVAEQGPSVASDLYTVARTLAVLTFDFQGYTNVFADSLPDPDHIEVFRSYESFYRLLVRATDPDPERRFASARGDGRAADGRAAGGRRAPDGRPRPALSTLFGPELGWRTPQLLAERAAGDSVRCWARAGAAAGAPPGGRPCRRRAPLAPPQGPPATPRRPLPLPLPAPSRRWHPGHRPRLPVPRVDPGDPNAGFLAGLLAVRARRAAGRAARPRPPTRVELRLRGLRARLETGRSGAGRRGRRGADAVWRPRHPDDWRVVWYRGLARWSTGDHETAALSFDAVYDAFPGEPAPKLALGICAEVLGQLDNAAEYYRLVWATDRSLRQRRLRAGPGAAGGGRPDGRGAGAGVRTGVVHPLHGGAGRGGPRPAAAARRRTSRCWPTCAAAAEQVERLADVRPGRGAARTADHRGTGQRAGLGTLR